MQKFYGKVTDVNGNPVASARLTIYTANVISPLPPVFSETGTGALIAGQNPLLTDANGEYSFVVAPGEYEIKATGSSSVLNISKTITEFVETASSTTSTPVAVTLNRVLFDINSAWTAPAGVIQGTVTCVGAGGGGGGGSSTGASRGGGAGGCGGATVRRLLPLTPGVTYAIVVGVGGNGGATEVAGSDGGNTTFGTLVQADGGKGGGTTSSNVGGIASTPGTGTLVGLGGGYSPTFTTTPLVVVQGFGAAVSGSTAGNGGSGTTGLNGFNGGNLETNLGGIAGLGDSGTRGGGGGGGSSAWGQGGNGGSYGVSPALSPNVGNYGAGGGGGCAEGAGAAGGDGLCIVEWIS